ncbi:hypothetical protein NDU88_004800 [Pleurodeles waltl]|uniref:Uncharacterized protein n=1 Tax=Pleurodeles waltl TaxID=8319 RepID=A0AAV7WTG3_PLEWA|nr:hypothetical protein NDU88_004800 [Pleurodeles waltl]
MIRRWPPQAHTSTGPRPARSSRARSRTGGVAAGRSRPARSSRHHSPGPLLRQGQRSPYFPVPAGSGVRSGPAGIRRSTLRAHRSRTGNGPRSDERAPIPNTTAAPTSQLRAQVQPPGGFSSGV